MHNASPRLVPAILALVMLAAVPAATRADTPGFALGPAHAAPPSVPGLAAVQWDPDGGGPAGSLFVIGEGGGLLAWDGSSFLSFGGFANGPIRSLVVFNGQLIVGGTFTAINGDSVTNLARWDGSHWQTLGTGLLPQGEGYFPKGSVNGLVVHGGVLYVAGSLVPATTRTWISLMTWNGSTLDPGRTTQAVISSLEEINTDLYATTMLSSPGVYRYDSADWTLIGTRPDSHPLALTSYNGDLICGGEFKHFFTGVNMYGIARWSGTQWVPLGAGLGPAGCEVRSLAVWNGHLVAAGGFDQAGGSSVHNIAQWDGTQWSDMDGGFTLTAQDYHDGVMALAPLGAELVAMGHFHRGPANTISGIARWNGDTWLAFHPGVNAPVRALLASGSGLYAGGDFTFDWLGVPLRHVVGYDGSHVNALAGLGTNNGVDGTVRALTLLPIDPFSGSELVAGGVFAQAGDAAAQDVAGFLYPGGWSALGNGLNGAVNALVTYNGSLYAAGAFTGSGATTLPHLARLSSGNWVDPGLHGFNTLNALAVVGGVLVIGGRFGGKPFLPPDEGVTAFDGTNEAVLGTSNGPVNALAVYQGDIVAAGAFTSMEGVATPSGIARRNATTGAWSAMGSAFALGVPYALAVYDGNLWVGGTLMQSVSASYGRLFEWNGSTWVGTAGVLDGPVYALAPLGTRLHIGGDFQRTDSGLESPYWITLNDGVLAVEPGSRAPATAPGASAPNPTHGASRVEFALTAAAHARVTILDVAGRQVRMLADGAFATGAHAASWDGDDERGRACAAGLYFYRIAIGDRVFTRRVVLAR